MGELIAGEDLEKGDLVHVGGDGKVYAWKFKPGVPLWAASWSEAQGVAWDHADKERPVKVSWVIVEPTTAPEPTTEDEVYEAAAGWLRSHDEMMAEAAKALGIGQEQAPADPDQAPEPRQETWRDRPPLL